MFHHQVALCLTGLHGVPDPNDPDVWHYTPMEEVLEKAGFEPIETYTQRRRESVYNNFFNVRIIVGNESPVRYSMVVKPMCSD